MKELRLKLAEKRKVCRIEEKLEAIDISSWRNLTDLLKLKQWENLNNAERILLWQKLDTDERSNLLNNIIYGYWLTKFFRVLQPEERYMTWSLLSYDNRKQVIACISSAEWRQYQLEGKLFEEIKNFILQNLDLLSEEEVYEIWLRTL